MPEPTIESLISRDPACCLPDDSAVECAQIMARDDVGEVPVLESRDTRRLLGVITDRDLCLAIVAEGRDPNEVAVGDCVTDEVITLAADDTPGRALELMQQNRLRRLCVVDEDFSLIGVVSHPEIARAAAASPVKQPLGDATR